MIKTAKEHHSRIAKASLEEEKAIRSYPRYPILTTQSLHDFLATCNHLTLNIHISNATPTKAHHQQWNTEKTADSSSYQIDFFRSRKSVQDITAFHYIDNAQK